MNYEFFSTLDDDSDEFVRKLSLETGVSPDGIISRVFGASMHDLSEYFSWIRTIEIGSAFHERAKNLLMSYGPESLLEGIRRLDPTFMSVAEKFDEEIRNTSIESVDASRGQQ